MKLLLNICSDIWLWLKKIKRAMFSSPAVMNNAAAAVWAVSVRLFRAVSPRVPKSLCVWLNRWDEPLVSSFALFCGVCSCWLRTQLTAKSQHRGSMFRVEVQWVPHQSAGPVKVDRCVSIADRLVCFEKSPIKSCEDSDAKTSGRKFCNHENSELNTKCTIF